MENARSDEGDAPRTFATSPSSSWLPSQSGLSSQSESASSENESEPDEAFLAAAVLPLPSSNDYNYLGPCVPFDDDDDGDPQPPALTSSSTAWLPVVQAPPFNYPLPVPGERFPMQMGWVGPMVTWTGPEASPLRKALLWQSRPRPTPTPPSSPSHIPAGSAGRARPGPPSSLPPCRRPDPPLHDRRHIRRRRRVRPARIDTAAD